MGQTQTIGRMLSIASEKSPPPRRGDCATAHNVIERSRKQQPRSKQYIHTAISTCIHTTIHMYVLSMRSYRHRVSEAWDQRMRRQMTAGECIDECCLSCVVCRGIFKVGNESHNLLKWLPGKEQIAQRTISSRRLLRNATWDPNGPANGQANAHAKKAKATPPKISIVNAYRMSFCTAKG